MTMVKKSISEMGSVNVIGKMTRSRIADGEELQINVI
jgi:hypothetical protein